MTDHEEFIRAFWAAVAAQDPAALTAFFTPDAEIFWHASNERFTRAEYVRANCEYPGHWSGEVERVEELPGGAVSAARVWTGDASFHAVSFYRFDGGRIARLDEYWGDDGPAPAWRRDLAIGRPIRT